MDNNVVEHNKKKNIIIGVIVCVLILIGVIACFLFLKKDKPEEPGKQSGSEQVDIYERKFTKFEKIKIGADNKEVTINNKKLNLKVVDGILYINDKDTNINVNHYLENDIDVTDVGVSDYLIFFYEPDEDFSWVNLVLDDNGNKVPFDKSFVNNSDDIGVFPVVDIFIENEKLMGQEKRLTSKGEVYSGDTFELKYDGKKITVEVKNGEIQLNENNKQFVLNGNTVNLKVIDNYLYVNDVKQEKVQFEENVYVTDKYILVIQVGQCGSIIDYAVNENGKVIKVEKKLPSNGNNYQVYSLRYENGKLIGEADNNCPCYDNCKTKVKNIEFSYDVDKITIKERS